MDGLLVERANGVVTLTIDRPQRKNAITGEMWRGLVEIFEGGKHRQATNEFWKSSLRKIRRPKKTSVILQPSRVATTRRKKRSRPVGPLRPV